MTNVPSGHSPDPRAADLPARLLEGGLALLMVLAPLPFGAVGPTGQLGLEIGALLLGLIWLGRAVTRPTLLPGPIACAGLVGLLLLAGLQGAPLGEWVVGTVSPMSLKIRAKSLPDPEARSAEERLLGMDPVSLDAPASLSVDRNRTASTARLGAALAVLLLVATTVAGICGVRRLVLALAISASFQGLYGLTVLISGFDQIWHLPKKANLDAATGTYVNPNHFACFLAMSLACGTALILDRARRLPRHARGPWLGRMLGAEGSRTLILALLLVAGLAGLLTSFSRAGIALGVLAVTGTILASRVLRSWRSRAMVVLLVVVAAAIPLLQIGGERLVERYAHTSQAISEPGARGVVWIDTLEIAAAFPIAGSGFGTFSEIYPLFRSPEVRKRYRHAHNDLLQAVAEGGLVGTLFLVLLLAPILRGIGTGLAGRKGILGIGVAAGLSAMLLHALIDFNFHIPANAATASVLAGAILGLSCIDRS